jgi:hypothetical protein
MQENRQRYNLLKGFHHKSAEKWISKKSAANDQMSHFLTYNRKKSHGKSSINLLSIGMHLLGMPYVVNYVIMGFHPFTVMNVSYYCSC